MSFSSETLQRGSDVENKENQSALLCRCSVDFFPACLCSSSFQAVPCKQQTSLTLSCSSYPAFGAPFNVPAIYCSTQLRFLHSTCNPGWQKPQVLDCAGIAESKCFILKGFPLSTENTLSPSHGLCCRYSARQGEPGPA